jgi:hypothetical protein
VSGSTVWKAWNLPTADRRALRQALTLIIALRAGLLVLPFNVLRRFLNRWVSCRKETRVPFSTAQIVRAVTAVGSRLSGTSCLVEALAADAMLRRHGHSSRLKLGVRRGADATFGAHAWVECDGEVVVGTGWPLEEYSVLS